MAKIFIGKQLYFRGVTMSNFKLIITIIFFHMNSLVFKSTFAQWTKVLDPLIPYDLTTTSLLTIESALFAGNYYDYGIVRSTDFGTTWEMKNEGLTNQWILVLFNVGENIYAGTDGGGIYRSTNMGENWIQINSGLIGWEESVYVVNSFCVFNDTYIFIGTDRGIFLSTNSGNHWTEKNNGLLLLPTGSLASIGNNLFAATNSGIFKSTDNGENWNISNNGIDSSTIITCLLSSNDNIILASTVNGIYRSTNYGAYWQVSNAGLNNLNVNFIDKIDSFLFAGTWQGGIYKSSDNGITWSDFNTSGLDNVSIETVEKYGLNIFMGTAFNGIWLRPISQLITSSEDVKTIIIQYSLQQNYPNPFNPKTKIAYQIAEPCFTSIKVFDLLGNELATLVQEEKTVGKYIVEFDSSELSSGIYFYSMIAGKYQETKKMILLK